MASNSEHRELGAPEQVEPGAPEHASEPKITLRKLLPSTPAQVDPKGNHLRIPDLAQTIEVAFPTEVYTGEYLNHGHKS